MKLVWVGCAGAKGGDWGQIAIDYGLSGRALPSLRAKGGCSRSLKRACLLI